MSVSDKDLQAAIRQVMVEMLKEQREEIIRRAYELLKKKTQT